MCEEEGGLSPRNARNTSEREALFLDTNAYALLLGGYPVDATARLRDRLSQGEFCEAIISELTALEIHSVVGQLSRGQAGGLHICERSVESQGGIAPCPHRWSQAKRKGLRPLEVDRIRKAIRDAESGHGPIRLKVVKLNDKDFVVGKGFLYSYAGYWRFGSHDAIIAAAAVHCADTMPCRLVTSDHGLKNLLRAVRKGFYDPLKDEEWSP